MPEQEIRTFFQIALELVDHLPGKINDDLRRLVSSAKDGHDPSIEIEIIDLISSLEVMRSLIRVQSNLQNEKDLILGGNAFPVISSLAGTRLAGNSNWIPSSQKWVCSRDKCDRWILVIQEGEEPPLCEKHEIKMVRGS